jgi:hypothetical protein
MKTFVFWVGWLYVLGGLLLFFPRLFGVLGVRPADSVFWSEAVGLLSMDLGLALVLCSRNLAARGCIAYWAGWTMVLGGAMEITFGLGWGLGAGLAGSGVFDVVVGLILVGGLPHHLGRGHGQLALDRG